MPESNSDKMREYHASQMRKHREAAREILAKADAEGRKVGANADGTPDEGEASAMQDHVSRVEEHEIEFNRIVENDNKRKMLDTLGAMADIAVQEPSKVEAGTPGEAFTASVEYQSVIETAKEAGFPEFRMQGVEMMAVVGSPILEGNVSNQNAIIPQWQNILPTPGLVAYPTVIQQILNIVQLTQGNTAFWPKVVTRAITQLTNTAESENKSGTDFAFDQASAALQKWTAFASVSEELFQDADILTNYINTQLGVMALQKEERAIANALYAASTTSTAGFTVAPATPNRFDAVLEAATMVRVAGGNPDFLLVNPYDWARMVATKSATSGDYFSGGPYSTPAESLWGLGIQQVQTPVIPRGTPLLGDSRGCILFRKGGLRTEASNSHGDFFRQNLVAIRSEIRSRLGVLYPEYFVEVTFGS